MNKLLFLFILLALLLGKAYAQPDTYRIEKLSKPEKLLLTVPANRLFERVEKNFLRLSVAEDLVDLDTHPVITGYLRAYQNHYPVTISPDIIWLLICQGFAHHVVENAEQLRPLFVDFDGKKTLSVIREVNGGLPAFPWETVFPDFVKQIAGFTGQEVVDHLSADFSTTTPTALIASQITIMESMKAFFNYKVMMIGCGIPEVTIEGTVADWEKIGKRLDAFTKYGLDWWVSELKPVIQKIVDTKKGKFDKHFWMNMIKYHKTGFYGTYDGIDGWFLKFYPYLEDRSLPPPKLVPDAKDTAHKTVTSNTRQAAGITLVPISNTVRMVRSTFKEIKSIQVLPKEISHVPFIFEIQDGAGKVVTTYNMEFWAGFFGVKQDKTTYSVKPEIGWAVNLLEEKKRE